MYPEVYTDNVQAHTLQREVRFEALDASFRQHGFLLALVRTLEFLSGIQACRQCDKKEMKKKLWRKFMNEVTSINSSTVFVVTRSVVLVKEAGG